ncbi:pilus assembly protein [Thalassococcus sp. CAU 1522]|uniref:Pilus assembly protein n=1 Tax=Thalassococcus arenae TaxID=2851652 RepID=A0ABS6N915_9RHOB|nr:pilus assembly protein [Thalassococcus arenae]MBV2360313.1 pilus assembly protein [Thalassococcus arenae]
MTWNLKNRLRRFGAEEDGTSTIAFALWVPLFALTIISTMEMGALSMRHTALERGLDSVVRDVRLNTGTEHTHDTLKAAICDAAPILTDCASTLRLEMIPLDLRNWTGPQPSADCYDAAHPVRPLRTFHNGGDNELMLLRACYKYNPIAPTSMLANSLPVDAHGYTGLVAFAAFVQEPI